MLLSGAGSQNRSRSKLDRLHNTGEEDIILKVNTVLTHITKLLVDPCIQAYTVVPDIYVQ